MFHIQVTKIIWSSVRKYRHKDPFLVRGKLIELEIPYTRVFFYISNIARPLSGILFHIQKRKHLKKEKESVFLGSSQERGHDSK
jgi:hypothetical protein